MANAFEYGDALLPQPPSDSPENNTSNANADDPTSPQIGSNQPYLNLATFVLLVLLLLQFLLTNSTLYIYLPQVSNGRFS